MDAVQTALCGSFPRRVGTPSQQWVFNEAQFALFAEAVDGTRNAYTTVGRYPLDGRDVVDKVFFDLDGDKAAFADDAADDERIDAMRRDPDLAAEVLGAVCADARRLARASRDDGIPVVGVFSGFGLHVHQLYQPTDDPATAMLTCAARYADLADLDTLDWAVTGDTQRLCRIPNMERATYEATQVGGRQVVENGRPTGCWTIPLTRAELCTVEPAWLIERSTAPRAVAPPDGDRPQMPVWSEYRDERQQAAAEVPQRAVDERTAPLRNEGLETLLWETLQMPCMVERILQPNPEHKVRFNAAVMLFNAGMTPTQVERLYAQLNWVDFDRPTTSKHLKSIYETGYADMSCHQIQRERLCTRAEEPSDCDCYGWSGGQPEWIRQQ